jgi:predicted DsbA family dithiol-disulfide isomerase
MKRLLFENQEEWRHLLDPTPVFESYARRIGLPLESFRELLARDAMAPLILSDILRAQTAGVSGTPTFVFNRAGEFNGLIKFYGDQPLARFEEYLQLVRHPPPAGGTPPGVHRHSRPDRRR